MSRQLKFTSEVISSGFRTVVLDEANNDAHVGSIRYGANQTDEGQGGEIQTIRITENYRGSGGAAKDVLHHAENELMRIGFREASLYIQETNMHARDFAKRMGWEEDGYLMGPSSPAVLRYRKEFGHQGIM